MDTRASARRSERSGRWCSRPAAGSGSADRGRGAPVETVELRLPPARLAGPLPGFVATDELLGAGDVLLLGVVLLLAHGPALAAQPEVLAVVARVPFARSTLQLENVVGGVLEKAAVVGHDQHAGAGEPKEFLKPL